MTENKIKQTYFTHQVIEKIFGEPNFRSLHDLTQKLRANASAVKTNLGGGNHGLLALVMPPAEYHNLTQHHWVEPIHPGHPPVIAVGTTQVAARNLITQYDEALKNWNLVNDTRSALKQQILDVIDEVYLQPLRDRQLAYANVTPLQMLDYLREHYGQVMSEDYIVLKQQLTEPYDPATSMVNYFNGLEDIQTMAQRGPTPITDNEILAQAYVSIKQTGIYERAIERWDEAIQPYRTWANFKRDFLIAYLKEQKKQRLQKSTTPSQPTMNAVTQQLAEQMSVLSEASQSDRMAMANLTTANATLANTNADLATKLKDALNQIQRLQQQVNALRNKKQGTKKQPAQWIHYCWSHGRTDSADHTSNNCRNRKPNHVEYATYYNRFGGSDLKCDACDE